MVHIKKRPRHLKHFQVLLKEPKLWTHLPKPGLTIKKRDGIKNGAREKCQPYNRYSWWLSSSEKIIWALFFIHLSILDSFASVPYGSTYTPAAQSCSLCPGIPCVNNLCKPDPRWIARGTGGAYDWALEREEDEARNDAPVSIYHCLIAPSISLGLVLFFWTAPGPSFLFKARKTTHLFGNKFHIIKVFFNFHLELLRRGK